jgi:hypothetical protein
MYLESIENKISEDLVDYKHKNLRKIYKMKKRKASKLRKSLKKQMKKSKRRTSRVALK